MNNIRFNQDNSCMAVASDTESRIFNSEPFGEIYTNDSPVFLLKVLFSTSLTIIVPKEKDNRLLKIFNLKQNLKICELIFPSSIVEIKINKKRLIVVLKIGQIYIYDLSYVKLIKIIEIEPLGSQPFVGDLSNDDHSLLVIPLKYVSTVMAGKSKNNGIFTDPEPLVKFNNFAEYKDPKGWVLVYDTINLKSVLIMKCHSSSIRKIVISDMIIATASSKGTIIRLFQLNFKQSEDIKLTRILNLRRGHNSAHIHCLKFNTDCTILACGSENTIHFFSLKYNEDIIDGHNYGTSTLKTYEAGDGDEHETDYNISQSSLLDAESSKSSEDLNENLANLLISKPIPNEIEENDKDVDNSIKNLPYKDYFNNLVLSPPRRSFNIIRLKDHKPGFTYHYVKQFAEIIGQSSDHDTT
ncbi:hypothetical protein CANTEDRAFT_132107 [Yamadazyma tenuis ATCC 10573]|uniref:Autophagy-related protein 18 n=1 Tax=Candida tenuis (strain ATCC 10573 / BCRC 21748 / CBS 615 / JCM 9827 / NBRC 10315 / NRRL Y-1498 / VKM Y-70) TaxID=590646 RepID=G3BDG9_CANTC|nr:uncharacterized protein CANTEDRAFT_132107 [Yamadazyma tenuis ATCC 10573]EGV60298.1 hypothetical protein CANTEDRAFT_132107 [Yamadazyma tenuis ATCC 10573]